MAKRRLRKYVLPSIYVFTIATILLTISFITGISTGTNNDYSFSTKAIKEDTLPVVNVDGPKEIIKPFNDSNVVVSKSYYDITSDEQTQQNSLIYYERTYMENTGILYTCDNEFDVISVLDGTVKDIKTDDILGNVVEVSHSNDLVTVYYSLGQIDVKKDDKIVQGQTIGKSGTNKIENDKENNLLFEVYYKGNLINPENFYKMNIDEL